VASGAGFPPGKLEQIVGIAKSYCTRVGEGPFPSEDPGEPGDRLREAGNEYGATTGRPRRCGWFDLVAARYAFELNGATGWVMTNLDVLTGFDPIPVVTAYRIRGVRYEEWPAHLPSLDGLEVERTELPGWREDITGARTWDDLPQAARDYVEWIEERTGVPIAMLSVGPERGQVVPRGSALLLRSA